MKSRSAQPVVERFADVKRPRAFLRERATSQSLVFRQLVLASAPLISPHVVDSLSDPVRKGITNRYPLVDLPRFELGSDMRSMGSSHWRR